MHLPTPSHEKPIARGIKQVGFTGEAGLWVGHLTFLYTLTETIYKVGGVAHETTIAMLHNRIKAASGVD